MTWTWLSISPGITTRPPQSTTSALPGARFSPTSAIVAAIDADLHAGLEGAEFGFEEGEVAEEVTYGTRSRSDLATDDATLHDHSHVLQPP